MVNTKRLTNFIPLTTRTKIWRASHRIKTFRPAIITGIRTHEKVVALTFDDGPNPTFTPQILDVLDRHQVKATFFVLGENASAHPELVRRAAQAGHTLGNHTHSHCHLVRLNFREIVDELNRCKQVIQAAGQTPQFLRPPFGEYDMHAVVVARTLGYQLVNWTLDTEDWRADDADQIVRQVLSNVQPGGIVLMHDGWPERPDTRSNTHADLLVRDRTPTVQALPGMITRLRVDGYRFVTLDELMKIGERLMNRW